MAVSFQKYPALIAPGKASGLRGLLKGPVPVKNDIKNRKRGKFPESNPPSDGGFSESHTTIMI